MISTFHYTMSCLGHGYYVSVFSPDKNKPGVQAWAYISGQRRIALIADSPDNKGVSVTNNFAGYAKAFVKEIRLPGVQVKDFDWYELDTMGRFDVAAIEGDHVHFSPIKENSLAPSSQAAFLARVWRTAPASMPYWHEVVGKLNRDCQAA